MWALSGDDSDLSYIQVPDPSSLQSPGQHFPPQACCTSERSPLPATTPTPTPLYQQSQQLLNVLLPRAAEPPLLSPISPTAQTRSVSATCRDAQTVPAPLSTVISLEDAIPSLRHMNQENTYPNTGSPASHSSGSATAIPAPSQRPRLDPCLHRATP